MAGKRGALRLAMAGALGLSVGGYLGGHLAYSEGVAVNRNADRSHAPTEWTDAAAASDVVPGELHSVEVEGQPVVLARHSRPPRTAIALPNAIGTRRWRARAGVAGLGGCRQRWAWARWPTSWLASQLPRSRTELAVPRTVPLRIQSVSVRPSTSAIVSARVARNAVRSASPDMCS
jgi:hypothetical protein